MRCPGEREPDVNIGAVFAYGEATLRLGVVCGGGVLS